MSRLSGSGPVVVRSSLEMGLLNLLLEVAEPVASHIVAVNLVHLADSVVVGVAGGIAVVIVAGSEASLLVMRE